MSEHTSPTQPPPEEKLLETLQQLHSQHQLNPESLHAVSSRLQIPAAHVEGVKSFYAMLQEDQDTVRLCDGIACWLKSRGQTHQCLQDNENTKRISCLGLCDQAPAAVAKGHQVGPVTLDPLEIPTAPLSHPSPLSQTPLDGELRLVTARCGNIDPTSLSEAVDAGAYETIQVAVKSPPERIISELEQSGLCGRGGAGFPTGRKWRLIVGEKSAQKFVICNADESEPLMFKDRVLLESDPHLVLEGMMHAGYAVGASQGIIYIRGEYTRQAKLLEHALDQAREAGLLGQPLGGSEFQFDIQIHRGAGAYICGEETALLESLEGKRGEPRMRPPYPAQSGFRQQPTLVNNVETLATVPWIIQHGGASYRSQGDPADPGTRLITILGDTQHQRLVELPLTFTLREILNRFGGGMRDTRFSWALTGGAAGTFVPDSLLDKSLNHSSWKKGLTLGSGGLLFAGEETSVAAALREVLHFFEVESCGKCTPCRVGTVQARRILDRLLEGNGQPDDLSRLRSLAATLRQSFCGLGTSIEVPLLSALNQFPGEFEELTA